MKKQQGFTLIELIIVIVILGILGVTAAPKFLSLSSDARTSTITGLKGALSAGASLVYSKAALDGKEASSDQEVVLTDGTVGTDYGYPSITNEADDFATELGYWMDLDVTTTSADGETTTGEWAVDVTAAAGTAAAYATFTIEGYTATDGSCEVVYTEASDDSTASVVATTGGC